MTRRLEPIGTRNQGFNATPLGNSCDIPSFTSVAVIPTYKEAAFFFKTVVNKEYPDLPDSTTFSL